MVLANTGDPQTKHCTPWKLGVLSSQVPIHCLFNHASLPAIYALIYKTVLILVHAFEIGKETGVYLCFVFDFPFLCCL